MLIKIFLGLGRTLGGNGMECCRTKGVSKHCLGWCLSDNDDSSARSGTARMACSEYEKIIETCTKGNERYTFIHELEVY